MSDKNPYAGKINNSGSQVVKGPYAESGKKGNSSVKTGTDLRGGKSK